MTWLFYLTFLMADQNINWEDPNLKINDTDASQLEAQIFIPKAPDPLKTLPKEPEIKGQQPPELDSKKNK